MENSPHFIDKSVLRKRSLLEEKDKIRIIDGFPLFTLVEFNTYGACNRSCSFCPVSDADFYKNEHKGISVDLYRKIMGDLKMLDYKGTILFSAFCEPFLNKDLPELVRSTKEFLPDVHLEIVSNGDIIIRDPLKLTGLYAAGLDTVCISVYDGPEAYERFRDLKADLDLSDRQIVLKRRYYDKEKGDFGMIISNRTNLVDSNKFRSEKEDKIEELPFRRHCFYPFYQTLVDRNGDMILCPHDWRKKYVIGNLKERDIWDLWTSGKYEDARNKLSRKNRSFVPCSTCDVYGDVIGKENYESWRNR